MRSITLKNKVEVNNRLEGMGIPRDALIEVVMAMVGAKKDCTDNDPPSAPGWLSWCFGTRRLRQVMRSIEGWEKDDTDQISSVVNKTIGVKIVVSNTDDATGMDISDRKPQNRSQKGAATDRIISTNQQSFLDILEESLNIAQQPKVLQIKGSITTFHLCVYHEGDVVRAELSCPVKSENGFFTDFIERIFLITDEDDTAPIRRRTVEEPDMEFDIQVARK